MNDRALELFKQAGATAYEQCKKHDIKVESNDITWTAIMASTLAELIVKECVGRCEDIGSHLHSTNKEGSPGDGAFDCAVDLKKHFGVE
jgi:hypothetical protein